MEVYTQVPDKTTRDALKRLGDLFGDQQSSGQVERQDDGVSTPGHQG
jgi:hypothetical protein